MISMINQNYKIERIPGSIIFMRISSSNRIEEIIRKEEKLRNSKELDINIKWIELNSANLLRDNSEKDINSNERLREFPREFL